MAIARSSVTPRKSEPHTSGATVRRKTLTPKRGLVERSWYVIDADGEVVGRLATEVARLLQGKHKTFYTPNVDTGDGVIVINASKVRFTGNKLGQKKVRSHSGFPGGLRERSLAGEHRGDPTKTIERAVRGMLPRTKLASQQFRHLRVYAGTEHEHGAQNPTRYQLRSGVGIHPQPTETWNSVGWSAEPSTAVETPEVAPVMSYAVSSDSTAGTSYETENGDFFATFDSERESSYGWHTIRSVREGLRICLAAAADAGRLGAMGEGGPAIGYYDEGELHVRHDLNYEELERAIDDWIPESGVKLARLETEFDTFVWEASSPLQNGQNSTSLAIISDSLPPKLLQHVWYQTSSSDKELERQLIQTSKHLHE